MDYKEKVLLKTHLAALREIKTRFCVWTADVLVCRNTPHHCETRHTVCVSKRTHLAVLAWLEMNYGEKLGWRQEWVPDA